MKLENYGLAIADCEDSIKLDPNYAKAYYRKADAHIALNKYEIARDCLKKVNKKKTTLIRNLNIAWTY